MCGIVAYLGEKEAYPILIKGLKRLEYRGYDSAGIALINGELNVYKKQGKGSQLEIFTNDKSRVGFIGIGHTRWATHGIPNDVNSHPHTSQSGNLVIVHNGIIENYDPIKKFLKSKKINFLWLENFLSFTPFKSIIDKNKVKNLFISKDSKSYEINILKFQTLHPLINDVFNSLNQIFNSSDNDLSEINLFLSCCSRF